MPIDQKITEEQAKLDDILQEQRTSLQSLNQLNLEKEGVQAGIDRLHTDLGNKKKDLDGLNADLDSASTRRAGVLIQIADLQTQISQATALLESTKTNIDKAASDGVVASKALQDAQDKIVADAQAQVDTLTAQKTQLEKEIAPIADQLSRLTDQVTALNAQIVNLNQTIDAANQTLKDIKNQIVDAQNALTELQTKNDELGTEITNKSGMSATFDAAIADKTAKIEDLEKQITDLKVELKTNNDQNVEFLKMRAGLIDAQQQVDQRLAFLKQKYGDVGETWQ